MTDWVLLQDYVLARKEDAFRVLVDRHLNLVYSAALRQLGSLHLAEEVAQAVFVELARWAPRLPERTVVPAWLYEVTRRKTIDAIRREQRRRRREQAAMETNTPDSEEAPWKALAPVLDEAMAELSSADRAAIVLRYFENKSLREVGEALGTSDDTAQKRVSRAVERLRGVLAARGMQLGAAAIATALSANAIQGAPAGLALAIGSAAAGVAQAGTMTLAQTFLMTTTQKAIVGAALLAAVCTGIYEGTRGASLRGQLRALAERQEPLAQALHGLRAEHDEALRKLEALRQENARLKSNTAELAKLRGEITQLRAAGQSRDEAAAGQPEPVETELKSWLARVTELKERLEKMPEHKVPEFELLTEQDWLDAAKREIRTEIDLRRALSRLRSTAQGKFAAMAHNALKEHMEANNNLFPNEMADLQPYLKSPVSQAVLDGWQIIPATELRNLGMGGDKIITQKRAVDDVFDTRFGLGPHGHGSTDFLSSTAGATLNELRKAYEAAYPGRTPKDPSELAPFAETPPQRTVLQKLLERKTASE